MILANHSCKFVLIGFLICSLAQAAEPDTSQPKQAIDPSGPSIYGQRGIFRAWTAYPSDPGSMVLGSSMEFFRSSDFLVDGDTNQRLVNRFSFSVVPFKGLEIAAGWSTVVNFNKSFAPEQTQSIGDPYLSLRYGLQLGEKLALGAGFQTLFPSGTRFSELSLDGISTRILLALDFRPIPQFLLSLNSGYHFDNSSRIFDHALNDAQRFSANINPHDQWLLVFGAAWQFGPIAPFLEYGTSQAMGADGMGFADSPNWLTIGLRVWPFSHHAFHIVAAADIGLTGTKDVPAGAARIPPYNIVVGLAYDFGRVPKAEPRVEIREVVKIEKVEVPCPPPPPPVKPSAGRIVGAVVDAQTGKPLGGARIAYFGKEQAFFLSDPEQGRFITCPADPGPVKLTVSLEGYREEMQPVLITEQPEIPVTIKLNSAKGQTFGTIKGTVRSATGESLSALISIPTQNIKASTEKDTGKFEFRLNTGTFDVIISCPDYVTQRRKIQIGAGDLVILNVELYPKK